MRTPRRHRLSRRHSEHLLDGRGGPDDLARLLADATPSRVDDELPGEAAALAAFRSAAVADLATQPRSNSVRTIPLGRSLTLKVLAVATAGVAVGGAAVAATGHLPGTGRTTPVASGTAIPTGTPTGTGSHGTPSPDRTRTGSPTGSPGARNDAQAVGLCRAWGEVAANDASALTRSTRFRDLTTVAGGADKVPGFCAQLTYRWCESKGWPTAAPVQAEGRAMTVRCAKPATKPGAGPSAGPTAGPSGNPSAGNGNGSGTPTPSSTPGKSGGQPTGGPVRS